MEKMHGKISAFTQLCAMLTCCSLAPAATADPVDGQIIVDPENPSWFRIHNGGRYFLAAPGDPENFLYRGQLNSDGTRSGDQDQLIDKLSGTGANGIYMQMIRSNGGDGDSTHNPFINNDPSQGLNDAVLSQWSGWFDRMDAAGITIYLFFYDDSASIWNTGNSVGSAERNFIVDIVNRFEDYKHLIWVVAEEYAEVLSPERVSNIARIIKETDDRKHPIAVHKNTGVRFDEFANDPNIDQYSIQLNKDSAEELHAGMVGGWQDASGRYNLNMAEAAGWGTGAEARKKAWAVAMGGAYVMGYTMDIKNTPISDLEDLGRLRAFMESVPFETLEPHDELGRSGTRYVLADPGNRYLLYGLEGSNALGVNMSSAGKYSLMWFDPLTGRRETQPAVSVDSGSASWARPDSMRGEVVLFLEKTDNAAIVVPEAPTELRTTN
jgi:hypothetical protein